MFSKFFNGQSEKELNALEMQWRMEMRKAQRKFQAKKKPKTTKGRPPLGQLHLNLAQNKAFNLSSIARAVATTREGQRTHERAAKIVESNKENSDKSVCVFFARFVRCVLVVCLLFLCLIVVICLFVVWLVEC